jgi:hypothetical protein
MNWTRRKPMAAFLALAAAGLPAQAQDPAAFCALAGGLTVELGQGLPLPNRYENPTDYTVTFNVIVENANIFNLPSPLTDPRYGTLVLKPHESRFIPDLAFPIPPSTPPGSDTLVLDVFGNASADPVWKIWGPFRCAYQLTVVPPPDLITVPVRWCAVEGSPQAEGLPGPTRNGGAYARVPARKLLAKLLEVNDQIYFPQSNTHVLFRPASAGQGIPVIDNPGERDGDCSFCKRTPGAFDPETSLDTAMFLCRQAWDRLYPGQRGTVLINATAFPFGISGATPGWDPFTLTTKIQPQLCKRPAVLDVARLEGIQGCGVFDPASEGTIVRDSLLKTLGHELGHSLALGHGDGLDNDGNGNPAGTPAPSTRLYDAFCDPRGVNTNDFPEEDAGTTARSLMDYNAGALGIAPLQKETLRSIAKLVPGAAFSGAADPAGSVISPRAPCEPQCALPADVEILEAGVAQTPPLSATTFWHRVRGPGPAGVTDEYLLFADLDGESSSGCDGAQVAGVGGLAGAELVSRVSVSRQEEGNAVAAPSVWRCQDGAWTPLPDAAIEADAYSHRMQDVPQDRSPRPHHLTVSLRVPDAIRGPMGDRIRVQAVARRVDGPVDQLPSTGDGAVISLVPAPLPLCSLDRPLTAPGGKMTVRASGLTPNHPADLLLGDQVVGSGATDAAGNVSLELIVPAAARQGLRPVTVLLRGGTENAACAVRIAGPAPGS